MYKIVCLKISWKTICSKQKKTSKPVQDFQHCDHNNISLKVFVFFNVGIQTHMSVKLCVNNRSVICVSIKFFVLLSDNLVQVLLYSLYNTSVLQTCFCSE